MGFNVKLNIDKRKLESAIKSQAREAIKKQSYDVECPHCHASFKAHSGLNTCPHCHKSVDLNLDIKF